jgi:D-glycero-D-manno-heptose 1,7-bisphosphate phosphatase
MPPADTPLFLPSPPGAFVDGEGVWNQVFERPGRRRFGALFLDRDGIVVEEVHYLHRTEDIRLVPAVADVIARANALGVPVVIVTNQSGIGRGLYDWRAFATVQKAILDELAEAGAFVDAVYACPHHRVADAPYDHPDHPARKPNPGMLLRAAAALPIDMASSWVVGDRASDVEAGLRAGIAGGVHVLAGHGLVPGERERSLALAAVGFRSIAVDSVIEAMDRIPLLNR